ncbi:MAG: hypothetical protein ACI4MO_06185 [Christensenellales bacterium]
MENKQDKFTFYQPYWDLVKDEDGATVKSIIGHICRYMLDGNEETPTDKTQALIWEDLVEVLAPQREKELQVKTPKAYNAKWKHFTFRRNYYNKMLSLEDDKAKEYLQAICELAFNGRQPKELSATVKKYYELTLLTLNTSIKRRKAGSKGGTAKKPKQETPTTLHTIDELKVFGCTGNLSFQNPILDGVDVNELYEFVKENEDTHSMSLYKAVETFRSRKGASG